MLKTILVLSSMFLCVGASAENDQVSEQRENLRKVLLSYYLTEMAEPLKAEALLMNCSKENVLAAITKPPMEEVSSLIDHYAGYIQSKKANDFNSLESSDVVKVAISVVNERTSFKVGYALAAADIYENKESVCALGIKLALKLISEENI